MRTSMKSLGKSRTLPNKEVIRTIQLGFDVNMFMRNGSFWSPNLDLEHRYDFEMIEQTTWLVQNDQVVWLPMPDCDFPFASRALADDVSDRQTALQLHSTMSVCFLAPAIAAANPTLDSEITWSRSYQTGNWDWASCTMTYASDIGKKYLLPQVVENVKQVNW